MSRNEKKKAAVDAASDDRQGSTVDAQTRRLVERSIVRLNGLASEAGERNDAIADHLFETFYDGDVQKALNPKKDAPAGFTALLAEADGALLLGRTQLFCAVRVGALNRRLARTAWSGLGWTVKSVLLRALGPELSVERVLAGATYAARQKASVRDVMEWVAARDEQASPPIDEEPAAAAPTFLSGRKAVTAAAALGRAADRRRWVDRLLRLPDDEQAAMRSAVKAAVRNLEKLSQEVEAAMEEA